jgi:quinoprotein glucose dehydrogenase
MPPITNFADGPSGLTYYPGTGFGDRLRDTFLLADFRGTAGNSGVRTFQLEADGAFYKLKNDGRFIWSILATDVAFGPEGAVYVSDWVNGWDGEGKGRIYRISDPQQSQSEIVVEVARLLAGDWTSMPTDVLTQHLGHVDRRIRNEAQWELARRAATADLLRVATATASSSLARLHAIWGLDQIYRRSTERSSVFQQPFADAIALLLRDDDAVLRAAAAKFAGENRLAGTTDRLIEMLSDASPRVRYHATRALGWQKSMEAFEPIVQLLMDNDNRDPVLRHGGIMALASVAGPGEIAKLKSHSSTNVRRAATVALRHLRSDQLTEFLNDGDTRVLAEAVRAIHDEQIDSAASALANLVDRPLEDSNVIHRVLNANFRLGGADHARALARYAGQDSAPEAMRLEAIAMLSDWQSPDERDRVLNDWRPLPERPLEMVINAIREYLPNLLSGPDSVRNATIELAARLGLTEIAPLLVQRVDDTSLAAPSRAAALRAMIQLSPEEAIARATTLLNQVDSPGELRVVSITVLATLQKSQSTDLLIRSTQERWSVPERQAAWDAIAASDSPAAEQAIIVGLAAVPSDPMEPVLLNLIEAAQRKALQEPLAQALSRIEASTPEDPLRPWLGTVQGGDPARGASLFFTKTELSCVRCHKVGDQGGDVGPNLTGIAKEKDRRYLLEAIVLPDQQIAKGFETTVLADDLGASHIGIVRSETDEYIDLVKADGSQVRLLVDEIVARRRGQSAMPADLVKFLTLRELRDLVAYLASLDQPPGGTKEKEGH